MRKAKPASHNPTNSASGRRRRDRRHRPRGLPTVILTLLLTLTIVLTLAGCGSPAAQEDTETVVTVLQGVDATTLDPNMHAETPTGNVCINLFDSLIWRDHDMKLHPGLAVSWQALDETTWEFNLRDDVTFHNGDRFTSADVKFTIERILDEEKNSPRRANLGGIETVETPDDTTVIIRTEGPFPLLLARLADEQIVPAAYTQEHGAQYLAANPVGTGPFVFDSWTKDDRIVLTANPDYWRGAPEVDTVIFRPVPEASTRVAELRTSNADIIVNLPPHEVASLKGATKTGVSSAPSSRVIFIGLVTTNEGPLADPRVRQALNHAVNVDQIINSILQGNGNRLSTPLPDNFFGADPSLEPYEYDPDRARALLAEAGYPDGFEITFGSPNGRYMMDKEVAQAVQGHLAEVGVTAHLNVLEWGVYVNKIMARELEGMYLLGWGNATFDADGTLYSLIRTGTRFSYYSNEGVDVLLDRARSTIDAAQREADYQEALAIIREEAPWIFLHQQQDLYGVSTRVDWEARSDERIWLGDVKVDESR